LSASACSKEGPPAEAPPGTPPVVETPLDPQDVVERITLAPHGVAAASGEEVEALAKRIQEDPGRYVPVLEGYLDLGRWIKTDDLEARRRAANAAVVLVEHGGEAGRAAAAAALGAILAEQEVVAARRAERVAGLRRETVREDELAEVRHLDRDLGALTELRNTIVRSLQNVGDPRSAQLLVGHLAANVDGLQAIAVPYLMETAADDPEVRAALRRLAGDPRSSFYRNQGLESFLAGRPRGRSPGQEPPR